MAAFCNDMETCECRYLSCFHSDKLFGTRVTHATNQHLQSLFRSCARCMSPADVEPGVFSFNDIHNDIVRYRFYCVVPTSLDKSLKRKDAGGTGQRPGSDDGIKPLLEGQKRKKTDGKFIRNENVRADWKLTEKEEMKKIFHQGVLDDRPNFNASCKLCHR